MRAFLPGFAALENTLDTTAMSLRDPGALEKSVATLMADDAVGSVAVAVIPGPPEMVVERARAVLSGMHGSGKPLTVSFFGNESPLPLEIAGIVRGAGACFLKSPDRALRALAKVTAYGRAVAAAAERGGPHAPPGLGLPASGMIAEYRSKRVIAALGIALPPGELARDLGEAHAAAKRIGYPVALKAQAVDLPHKNEAGGLAVDIGSEAALEAAWTRIEENLRRVLLALALEGMLVEAMGRPGIEMLVGARRDPNWGPMLTVGLGDVWVEALKNVRVLAPDLPAQLGVEEILRLRAAAVLQGVRGAPPADLKALAQAVARLGGLMLARPEIIEVDINPLAVHPRGEGVTAFDALVVTGAAL